MQLDLLNDDCLIYIFKFLRLKDQLNTTQASRRFRDVIVEYIWTTKYRELYTNPPVDVEEKISNAYNELAELDRVEYQRFYSMHVQHVEKLHIGNITFMAFSSYLGRYVERPDLAHYFWYTYPRLLEFTCLDPTLHDAHIATIAKSCPRLQALRVRSAYITGRNMRDFRRLIRLNVSDCAIESDYLDEVIAATDTLIFLNVCGNWKLQRHCLATFGRTLRELQIDELQFLKQFGTFPMPQRLGALKFLNVICDTTPKARTMGWSIIRKDWIPFFDECGPSVKVLKMLYNSEAIIDALENAYYASFRPTFPRMEELYLKTSTTGYRLKPVFVSKTLRQLYVHDTHYLHHAFELLENSMDLNLIIIEGVMEHNYMIFEFIRRICCLLDLRPSRHNVLIHLVNITTDILPHVRGQIARIFGCEIFNDGSRVRVRVFAKTQPTETRSDRWIFEFHEQIIDPPTSLTKKRRK